MSLCMSKYLNSLYYLVYSPKLSDLKKYFNTHIIYYIVDDGMWVILDSFNESYINYCIVNIKPKLMQLILHSECMLVNEHFDELKMNGIIARRSDLDYVTVSTDQVDDFIHFLDTNKAWLNSACRVNNYINYEP